MGDRSTRRRLAAILAADIAGYTRLMEQDTDGTVAAWRAARLDVIDPRIAQFDGRIVKHTGDGFLAEFGAVTNAVNCAIAMQDRLREGSLQFRMGVHMGEVVEELGDIHGEGVNIAARLESLANAGTICVSGSVYEQVRNRIAASFEDWGEKEVKHVSAPVRVYAIGPIPSEASGTEQPPPADAVEARPSIAVLPFDNMSGDAEQEYFADGLTEDIITALASWHAFPVIGRNSTFTYKGMAVKAQDVARDLGARYVLEGSVRKGGNRVRITAQLIDTGSGHHVWADRFDRDMADVFAVQDEITEQIVSILVPEIERAELKRAATKEKTNLDAWDFYLQGLSALGNYSLDGNADARGKFESAIVLDPGFAKAHARLALTYLRDVHMVSESFNIGNVEKQMAAAKRAIELDDTDSFSHWVTAIAYLFMKDYDRAIRSAEQAVKLNPTDVDAHFSLGNVLGAVGRREEALSHHLKAVALGPRDPRQNQFHMMVAMDYLATGRFDDAVDWARKAIQIGPPPNRKNPMGVSAHLVLASALGHLGRIDEAREAVVPFGPPIPGIREMGQFTQRSRPESNAVLREGLEKAEIFNEPEATST